jgi:hypothetical protein
MKPDKLPASQLHDLESAFLDEFVDTRGQGFRFLEGKWWQYLDGYWSTLGARDNLIRTVMWYTNDDVLHPQLRHNLGMYYQALRIMRRLMGPLTVLALPGRLEPVDRDQPGQD